MSKTINANLKAELESGAPIIATCWKIERKDGVIQGFTDWPVSFDYLGLTYDAESGYDHTALDQAEGLNIDNMDIMAFLDSDIISEEDILSGKYRNAKIWIFIVSPPNLAWGDMKLDHGFLGEITVATTTFKIEFRSLSAPLQQNYGNKYSRYCRHPLGSSRIVNNTELACGIVLEPDVWTASTAYAIGDAVSPSTPDGRRYVCTTAGTSNDTEGEPTWDTTLGNTTTETDGVAWKTYDAYTKYGTVTSVTNAFIFTDSSFTDANGWYKYGVLTWLNGPNVGTSYDIKDSTSSGVFTLRQPASLDISIGQLFKVTWGCNHILKMSTDVKGSPYTGDCRAKFKPESTYGNVSNFGGEPELPNLDRIATPASRA